MTVSALWLQHRSLARLIAREYFWAGAEAQDVEQEALIGLWIAARDYRSDRGTAFKTFADIVIRRRLIECVRIASRLKHRALNESLRMVVLEDGPEPISETLPCLHQVSDRVEDREQLRAVLYAIDHDLSDLERTAVIGIACGLSYAEIGNPAQVDNALMRARTKLRAAA